MTLYRAVSNAELKDYHRSKQLRTSRNTIEGKQFFKTREAVNDFVADSRRRTYEPPYEHVFEININILCLELIDYEEQELDTFKAITIKEADLPKFNECINFIDEYDF